MHSFQKRFVERRERSKLALAGYGYGYKQSIHVGNEHNDNPALHPILQSTIPSGSVSSPSLKQKKKKKKQTNKKKTKRKKEDQNEEEVCKKGR